MKQTNDAILRPPRPAEYWEVLYERFPAATVLDDLSDHPDDVDAARWIVVRYACVRAAASLLGVVSARELRHERNVGLNHLSAVPMLDREAWSLKKMLDAVKHDPMPHMVTALLNAADAAVDRGHTRGAHSMFQLGYRLSTRYAWHALAGRSARGIERLAIMGGAVYSPRLWRRRARVMEKRAAVA